MHPYASISGTTLPGAEVRKFHCNFGTLRSGRVRSLQPKLGVGVGEGVGGAGRGGEAWKISAQELGFAFGLKMETLYYNSINLQDPNVHIYSLLPE